ncbi:MAG: glycine zipper 2TM domain-containing protein [Candidatus Omnitrophota bacterium]
MRTFRSVIVFLAAAGFVLTLSGCETMGEDTKRGALGGGVLGAVAGGVIGHQGGHGIEGAAIGAATGAIAGGLIGKSIDDRKKEQIMAGQEKLGISDVIILARAGLTDDAIITKIRQTGSVYNLSVEEIQALQKEGVSNEVINYMMSTTKK